MQRIELVTVLNVTLARKLKLPDDDFRIKTRRSNLNVLMLNFMYVRQLVNN